MLSNCLPFPKGRTKLQILRFEVNQFGEIRIRVGNCPRKQTSRVIDGISQGIPLLILENEVDFSLRIDGRRDTENSVHELDIVPIHLDLPFLVRVRSVSDLEAKFLGRRTKEIGRTSVTLVNLNEILRHTIYGDGLRICEHVVTLSGL